MIKNADVSTHDLQTFNLVSTLISIINKNNDTDMNYILANYFLKKHRKFRVYKYL